MVDDYSSVMSWAVSGAILLLVIIFLSRCVAIVPTQSAYIVERLGKFRGVLHAGFHVLIPFFDRVAYRRSLKEQVLDVPEQTCITRDNVSVSIDGVLFLQVLSPEKSAYGISDYEWGAIQLAQTALRSAIGKLEMDKTFEERARINQEVVEALDSLHPERPATLDDATAAWGVKVLRYEIRDITPPASVMEAMEKQMRAEREKRAVIAQSEGNMQSQINLAEGAKAAAIAESEGLKQAMINKAEGEAAQIRTVAQATADGLDAVAMRLDAQGGVAAAQLRLAEAYVEKFGELAKKGTTTIIPANVGDVAGMVATLTQILRPGEGLSKPSGPGTGAPQA